MREFRAAVQEIEGIDRSVESWLWRFQRDRLFNTNSKWKIKHFGLRHMWNIYCRTRYPRLDTACASLCKDITVSASRLSDRDYREIDGS
jgi:hypothetical protein